VTSENAELRINLRYLVRRTNQLLITQFTRAV